MGSTVRVPPAQAKLGFVRLVAIRWGLLGVEVLNELTDTPSTPAEVASCVGFLRVGGKK